MKKLLFIGLCGALLSLTACRTFSSTEEDLKRERQQYNDAMQGRSQWDGRNPSSFGRPSN
jgi:hypothetical protein